MATTKHRGKSPSGAGQAQLIETLTSSASNVDQQTIVKMAKVISGMAPLPVKMAPPSSATGRTSSKAVPRLTNIEVVIMTLLDSPNEWFLVKKSKKRGGNGPLRSIAKGMEIVTRANEAGEIEHYARFTGGALTIPGGRKVKQIREKLQTIKSAVESGLTVTSTRMGKATKTKPGSLNHVIKYPMNETEELFLEVLKHPNSRVLLRSGAKANEEFFTFRWKWSTRYGFDLSQFTTSQEALPDGTFNLYGQYTPTSKGEMNASLAALVDVLEQKRQVRDSMKLRRESVTNTTVAAIKPVTQPAETGYIRL